MTGAAQRRVIGDGRTATAWAGGRALAGASAACAGALTGADVA